MALTTTTSSTPRRSRRSRYNHVLIGCLLVLLCLCCEARAPGGRSAIAATSSAGGPLSLFLSTIKEARRHLAAAAVARSVSIFAMYPVDTIKTRVQMEQANPMRMVGLYKGVEGSLVGQMPYG
jgi:hypothetical protein